MSIEFNGLDKVLAELEGPLDPDKLDKALMRACLVVEDKAREYASIGRGSGDLGRSITSKVEDGEGIVYTPLEYGPYVEYGTGLFAEEGGRTDVPWCYYDEKTEEFYYTSGQHPKPFMRPALDESREDIINILREGILND